MRRVLISLSAVLLVALAAQAQITITYLQVPHTPGNQFQYYSVPSGDSVLVNIGQPGGPQTWNFTSGDTTAITTDTYLNPAQSPPEYARANTVIQTDALNLFGMGEPGNLYCWLGAPRFILGAATTTYSGTPVGMTFTPYITQYPLPLTYGRTWANQLNVDQIYNISGTEYRIVLNATLNSTVDAWGTVQVPLGSYPALRTRTNVTYDLTIYIHILFIWVPINQQSGSSVNYDWRAQDVGLVATLTTQATGPGQVWTRSMRRLMHDNLTDAVAQIPSAEPQQPAASHLLNGNYPNPFNSTTAVSYKLQASSQISLQVFDVAGRLVTTLVDGWQEAGEHQVTWVPQNLAAGVYYLQFRAGNQVDSRMMLYLK